MLLLFTYFKNTTLITYLTIIMWRENKKLCISIDVTSVKI